MQEVPDGYEWDEDRLVPLRTGARSSWVAGHLASALMGHCDEHELGWVFPAGVVYRLFSSRRTTRRPDASFVRFGRIAREVLPDGDLEMAPDLAVEVIAPGDLVEELDWKLEDYRRAGVRLVWVINPDTKAVIVHRKDGTMARLNDRHELEGEDIVPGFRYPARRLWPENAFEQAAQPQT